MRTCNRYQRTELAGYNTANQPYRWVNDSRSHTAKSQHVVFFFMGSSTCSHCWKQAMALARINDHLVEHNTTVLLVGDGRYKKPAQRLVKELNLPFRYISDNGALRRYYHVDAVDGQECKWALLLVDTHGVVRFCRFGSPGHICHGHGMRDFTQFLSSVRMVDRESQEHIMSRLQLSGCDKTARMVPQ